MDSRELLAVVPLARWEDGDEVGTNLPSSHEEEDGGGGQGYLSGSLEDLVHSFDEKLTVVFENAQSVDELAPVQVRSQEEIMEECQVWWTITGNFGSMMPIDWTKSSARSKQFPALNLCGARGGENGVVEPLVEDEEDLIAADLDMHTLILSSQAHLEPLKSAEEVLQEIEDLISGPEDEEGSGGPLHEGEESYKGPLESILSGRPLKALSLNELTALNGELEYMVRELSEELVSDLGVRDELEMEKELKNSFISLLLNIQSKLRGSKGASGPQGRALKYLTTVIPYANASCPPVSVLCVLVKILKAINEDSPAVPALLTDYILKILCPSA